MESIRPPGFEDVNWTLNSQEDTRNWLEKGYVVLFHNSLPTSERNILILFHACKPEAEYSLETVKIIAVDFYNHPNGTLMKTASAFNQYAKGYSCKCRNLQKALCKGGIIPNLFEFEVIKKPDQTPILE